MPGVLDICTLMGIGTPTITDENGLKLYKCKNGISNTGNAPISAGSGNTTTSTIFMQNDKLDTQDPDFTQCNSYTDNVTKINNLMKSDYRLYGGAKCNGNFQQWVVKSDCNVVLNSTCEIPGKGSVTRTVNRMEYAGDKNTSKNLVPSNKAFSSICTQIDKRQYNQLL
jgi:hypothetical protein